MTDETIFDDKNTHEMNTNQLTAYRIKEERLRLNYSQQAVADYLSMDISNYSRLENGKLEITISKLEAISEFFNIPLTRLIPNTSNIKYVNNGDNYIISDSGTINCLDKSILINLSETLETLKNLINKIQT